MRRILLLLSIVAVAGLSASATHYTIAANFFCDNYTLTLDKGLGPISNQKIYVWGDHDLNTRCGFGAHLDTVGLKHALPAQAPPNNLFGTASSVLDISDAEGPLVYGFNGPVQQLIRVNPTSCGIAWYEGGASQGGVFVINEDTCTVGPAAKLKKSGGKPGALR